MTAQTKSIRLLILHETELRKASTLITQAMAAMEKSDAERGPDSPINETAAQAIWLAFRACAVALRGVDSDRVILMLSTHEIVAAQPDEPDAA